MDMVMGEELELGPLPLTVQLEEAGQRVPWGLVMELAQEGPLLSPLGLGLIKVDGTEQMPENGAIAEDAVGEQVDSLPS